MEKPKFNRITAIMAEEDIDNSDLAEYMNVTIETISKWRTNRGQPSLEKLFQIAEFFKMPVSDFLTARSWEPGPSKASLLKIEKEENKNKITKKKSSKKTKNKKGNR